MFDRTELTNDRFVWKVFFFMGRNWLIIMAHKIKNIFISLSTAEIFRENKGTVINRSEGKR
jgi:hypothetical protein